MGESIHVPIQNLLSIDKIYFDQLIKATLCQIIQRICSFQKHQSQHAPFNQVQIYKVILFLMGTCFSGSSKKDLYLTTNHKEIDRVLLQLWQSANRKQRNPSKCIVSKAGVRPINNRARISIEVQKALANHSQIRPAKANEEIKVDGLLQFEIIKGQIQNLKVHTQSIVQDKLQYPYSAIGAIIVPLSRDEYIIGTGTIIGPQLILTCAHNCFNLDTKTESQELYFTPSPEFPQAIKKYKAKIVHYPPQFRECDLSPTNRKNQYIYRQDYAIIELSTNDNLQEIYGSLGYDLTWSEGLSSQVVRRCSIIGYPQQQPGEWPEMREMLGDIYIDQCIRHTMPTKVGSSGSPIIQNVGQAYVIRGIHNTVNKTQKVVHMTGILLSEHITDNFNCYIGNSSTYLHFDGYRSGTKMLGNQGLEKVLRYETTEQLHFLQQLTKLIIISHQLYPEGCQSLLQAPLKNIKYLVLTNNFVGDKGCQYLKQAAWDHLTVLGLSGNAINDEGCRMIKQAKWPDLQQLWLTNNSITKGGTSHLVQIPSKKLTTLALNGNSIGDEGCYLLAKTSWPLKSLGLSQNSIGSQGCRHLKQSKWSHLSTLGLWDNRVDLPGYRHLSKIKSTAPITVYLWRNKVSKDAKVFKKKSNTCTIWL